MGLKWIKKPKKIKNKKADIPKEKKKVRVDEFSKWIVFSAFILLCVWVTASYTLAWFDKNVNEGVTVALISYTLSSVIGYFISNSVTKNSRNKYGIDSDGNPHTMNSEENETDA